MKKVVLLFLFCLFIVHDKAGAESTNQTITGTIGVTLSIELLDENNNEVSSSLGFGSLVFDGVTDNVIQSSVQVSTNSSSGLRLFVRGNNNLMFKDNNLDNSYQSGEITIPNPLRVEGSASGVFNLNISEREITTTNVEIGRSNEVTNAVTVPLSYKVIIPSNQEAGVYKMLVTLSVSNS